MTPIRYRRDLWRVLEGLSGNAAEIGVAEGHFSAEMLSWPINFPIVYMVDRWRSVPEQKGDASNPQSWHDANYNAAVVRVFKYHPRGQPLCGDSAVMGQYVRDRTLALVYIDGDHSYEGVTRDINAWILKLVPGGVMAFHDYEAMEYGVNQAVREFCMEHGFLIHYLPEDKLEDAGAYFYVGDNKVC